MDLQDGMLLRIWDVEHGACAMLHPVSNGRAGRLAMFDSGCTASWNPSSCIKNDLFRDQLDYLFISNADQDHMADLEGLWTKGIKVGVVYKNPSYTADQIREIKRISGPLTNDAERYARTCEEYVRPVSEPFNDFMGGIKVSCFWNKYPHFKDTNNLSLAVFVELGKFKILFPGDLEGPGWKGMLANSIFQTHLQATNILVASHHGRRSGYHADIFDFCSPQAVVISDKSKGFESQNTIDDYRAAVKNGGVRVRTTRKMRRVLTTRRDGWIQFSVEPNGSFFIDTEYMG